MNEKHYVKLVDGTVLVVEADDVVSEGKLVNFFDTGSDWVASFPVSSVLCILRENVYTANRKLEDDRRAAMTKAVTKRSTGGF